MVRLQFIYSCFLYRQHLIKYEIGFGGKLLQEQQSMIAEEVQIIRVQPAIIARAQNLARKSYKIIHWLKLLSMLRENGNDKEAQQLVKTQLHHNFIMNEGFWQAEVTKKLTKESLSSEDIDYIMMAFDDGTYYIVAMKLALRAVQEFKKDRKRTNFALSIIEKLIYFFNHEKRYGSEFYKLLRKMYIQLGNVRKIRSIFQRELQQHFDDCDLCFDEYLHWEQDKSYVPKMKTLYEAAKQSWEKQTIDFDQQKSSQLNLHRTLLELQSRNSTFKQEQMIFWLQKLQTTKQKIWFLRKWALNYRQTIQAYLKYSQVFYESDDETIIRTYKTCIRLSDDDTKIQERYLYFLARRINRHLFETQQKEYNDTWGEKVAYLRDSFNQMITKTRKNSIPEKQSEIFNTYYKLWIEIEQFIVKDKETVCQLYENLIKSQSAQIVKVFFEYSQSLKRMGAYKQAKNILRRLLIQQNTDQSRQYFKRFIQIYGSIDDQIQFGKDIQTLPQKRQQQKLIIPQKMQVQIQSESKGQSKQQSKKRLRNKQFDETEQKIESATRKKVHVDGENTVYMKGIPVEWTESDVLSVLNRPEKVNCVRLVEKHSVKKDYCYIQFQTKEVAEEQVKSNKSGYQMLISKPPSDYDESKTIFICALPQTATKEKISELFGPHNKNIVEIRLKLDRQKNFAYVDFDSKENKDQAFEQLHKNSILLDGKKILMQHCQSHRQKNKKFLQVVFLKGLAFKADQRDVQAFFKDKKIANISIPRNSDGKAKGIAYVEFEKFKDYQQALDLRKGTLMGRQFQILKSDRQITQPNPSNQQKQPSNQSHTNNLHQKDKRRQKPQKKQQPAKDNNFFSNLFK